MRSTITIFIISLTLFFLVDFFLGNKVINLLYSFKSINSPDEIKKERLKIINKEKEYRIKNPFFHHTLKANIKTKSHWGNIKYNTCTNKEGFRIDCDKKKKKEDSHQIIFIGDSFTEGLGLDYHKTFVGLYDDFSNYSVLNMGVTSYSPIIYYNKIKYFLNNNLKIDHVIVFLDISDIDDEANYYERCKDSFKICDKKIENNKQIEIKNNKNFIEEYFPLLNFISTKTKEMKRKIKPKNYIYREDFQRSAWTYKKNNENYQLGIDNSLKYMTLLSNILKQKKIKLSLAVYPHPATLIYDDKKSKHVKIWSKFCLNRCENFINLFPTFFNEIKNNNEMKIIKKYYISNDIHFNEEGNKKIFNFIKKYNFGAPDRSRTHNLRSRNPALYPVEATGAM